MGKFTTGPDEYDVMSFMKAMEAVHAGRVELIVSSPATGFSPYVNVTLRCTFDVLDGSALPKVVEVSNAWPCSEHATLWAHCYDGAFRLDAAIQRAYEQMTLPE